MINLCDTGVFLVNGDTIIKDNAEGMEQLKAMGLTPDKDVASKGTIAYSILQNHNKAGTTDNLKLKFDAMASHDITYVSIIQTAKASGLEKFPIPYVLTCCHNTLCAVGGTINEDDHIFGLSAAKKYGGSFVPPHMAVIHQYMREIYAGCGKMILGSDSHTRYGALGTIAIGEGGGELVKQLLSRTYDISYPEVIGVYLTGKPRPGVGPQDIALSIIGAVFGKAYVKNKIMEFIGDGIENLPTDFRNGIDVMTTETTCLSSIWQTDKDTKAYLNAHGRVEDYKELKPQKLAYYDGLVHVNLSEIKPMIALPFHPSNTYEIETLNENLEDILHKVEADAKNIMGSSSVEYSLRNKIANGKLKVDQGIIAGCAGGTHGNIMAANEIIGSCSLGHDQFSLSVYPASQTTMLSLTQNGTMANLMKAGATIRTAFCGPCFGAGDVPSNNALSIRHTTRNFPNREGSKPSDGQIASVALMDARSIAATAVNGGYLTPADKVKADYGAIYHFDSTPYQNRVYDGVGKPQTQSELIYGPNIVDWPEIKAFPQNLIMKVVSFITDEVTTTDELIPSGETSSYRSNPLRLAEFTLSRKDPDYVGKAKQVQQIEKERLNGVAIEESNQEMKEVFKKINQMEEYSQINSVNTGLGTVIYAKKPGDGSAREQAASCQKVLGGIANIAYEYATKRYRSNLINWGMIPFLINQEPPFENGDYIFIPDICNGILTHTEEIKAYCVGKSITPFTLFIADLTDTEKQTLISGCLMNYYKRGECAYVENIQRT